MENSGEEIVADDKAAQSTYGIFHVCGVLAFCENTESIAKCSPLEKWKQRIPMEMTEARFRQTFEFLKEHHWIHDLHLTKFFESQVWTQIPKEWDRAFTQMTVEELNKLPFVEAAVGSPHSQSVSSSLHLPDSLQLFLQHSTSLTFERDHVTGLIKSTPVGKELAKGMSPKKLHEVQWMASLVHQVAAQADCDVVVDIGSGLGYLGQVLHTNYGLKVIGLEGSVGHTERAEKRAAKHGLQCSGMKSVPFEIRDDEEHITKFCDLIQREASTITQCKHSCPADLHMRSPGGHNAESRETASEVKHSHQTQHVGHRGNCDRLDASICEKQTPSCKVDTGGVANEQICAESLPHSCTSDINLVSGCGKLGVQKLKAMNKEDKTSLAPGCFAPSCKVDTGGVENEQICVESLPHNCTSDRSLVSGCGKLGVQKLKAMNKENKTSLENSCFAQGEQELNVSDENDKTSSVHSCIAQETRHLAAQESNKTKNVSPSDAQHTTRSPDKCVDGGEGHSVSSCTDEVTITKERETDAVNHSLRVCLIGLHCCGDLTPALLRLFERVEFIRAVCCVSCCYHKMQLIPGTDQFHNFPMSKAAKDVYTAMQVKSQRTQEHAPTSFISPCSLRLAAQETRARWASQTVADHDVHMKHVAFRALLELYRGDTGSKDRRTVRRLDYSTVDQFVDSYVRCPEIPREEQQATKEQLYKLYAQVQPRFHHIEPFTCLQVILQPVLESLVLLDRQCWLQENGFHADIVPIFQEEISPRNLALVSTKSQN